VWFDFATLCESNRSQNDYLELAQEFRTVLSAMFRCSMRRNATMPHAASSHWWTSFMTRHQTGGISGGRARAALSWRAPAAGIPAHREPPDRDADADYLARPRRDAEGLTQ